MRKFLLLTSFSLTLAGNAQTLLLDYHFDGNLNDGSGNNYHATKRVGSPTFTQGRHSDLAVIINNNSNDVLLFPDAPPLQPTAFPVTISATFRINNLADSYAHTLFHTSLTHDSYHGVALMVMPNGSVSVNLGTAAANSTNSANRRTIYTPVGTVQANQWYHVTAIVRSDSDMEIWVNCQQYLPQADYGCGTVTNTSQTYLSGCADIQTMQYTASSEAGGIGETDNTGNNYTPNNTYFFSGVIDDVKFWTGELSIDQILSDPVNIDVTVNASTITSDASGATSFQWINCSTMQWINNQTAQSYTPSNGGAYAVIVDQDGCADTSECIQIDFAGIAENALSNVHLYPNPVRSTYTVDLGILCQHAEVTVTDQLGRIVDRRRFLNASELNLFIDEAPGVYAVNIVTEKGESRLRFVKE